MMHPSLYKLSEREIRLKKLYMNGNKYLMKVPMSFEDYKSLVPVHSELAEGGSIFENMTKGHLGTTLIEVEKISEGDEIVVFVNDRYNYPVLHNHSFIEMIYVYNGTCTHFVENQSFTLKNGDLCILVPHAMHAITAEEDDAIAFNILISRNVFNNSFLKILNGGQLIIEFFENVLFNKRVSPYVIFPTKEDPWLHETIFNMFSEYDKKPYAYKEYLNLYIKQMFIHLIRHYEMSAILSDSIDNSMEDNIVAILGYISVNYAHTSLKELASFFNYSETYLSRLLRRYTGKTFGMLITEIQMKYAKELIESGCMNMTEISQKVGCFDASHLNRKFKRIYGKSPHEFKKCMK